MKAGWQLRKLGDVCRFVRGPFGGSLKKSVFVADGYAVYEQSHAIYEQFEEIRYFVEGDKFREMQRFEIHSNDLIELLRNHGKSRYRARRYPARDHQPGIAKVIAI